MSKNGWLSRNIASAFERIAPGMALRRKVARAKLHAFSSSYRATSTGRLRWSRGAQAGSGDYHLTAPDLASLRGQHRDFDRNNCIFSGLLTRWVDNVIGGGFTFQMRSDDSGLNQAVEDGMNDWAEHGADYRGILSLWEIKRLLLREVANGGDMLFAKVDGALQPLEPDLCLDPIGKDARANIYNGVEKDEFGRVVQYHIGRWKEYGYVDATDTTPVPPEEIIHVFSPKRFSQSRGVPLLTGGIELFERLDDYIEATLVAAQVGACQGVAVKTAMGADLGAGLSEQTETTSDDEDMPTREMEPGMMWFLREGEDVENIKPEQPTQQFEPFIAVLMRFLGLELGMPLELSLLDWSKGNFSSQKAALTQAMRAFRIWQQIVNQRFLRPVTEWKLPAIFREVGARFTPEMGNYIWIPPGWKWLDPPRETQGHISAAEVGVETMQQIAAEQGDFWKDQMGQRATEIGEAMAAAKNLGADVSWRDLIPAGQSAAPAAPAAPEAEENPDGADPIEKKEELRKQLRFETLKGKLDAYGIGVRAGAVTPQEADETALREEMELPPASPPVAGAWRDDEGVRRPITLQVKGGEAPSPFGQKQKEPEDNDAGEVQEDGEEVPDSGAGREGGEE